MRKRKRKKVSFPPFFLLCSKRRVDFFALLHSRLRARSLARRRRSVFRFFASSLRSLACKKKKLFTFKLSASLLKSLPSLTSGSSPVTRDEHHVDLPVAHQVRRVRPSLLDLQRRRNTRRHRHGAQLPFRKWQRLCIRCSTSCFAAGTMASLYLSVMVMKTVEPAGGRRDPAAMAAFA